MKSRILICGWKQDMDVILLEMLKANPDWTPENITVIGQPSESIYQKFAKHPLLGSLNVIRGEYYTESTLSEAKAWEFSKIIVVADWANRADSATETDAKTIMAAMTVEKIAPEVYLIAEILDPRFSVYLRMAKVDEIIYTKEYSRILIANSILTSGIAHVIYDILNVDSSVSLTTKPIPDKLVGEPFTKLYEHYLLEEESASVCLGILENTENLHVLRRHFMAEVQKNVDLQKVLSSLKSVKEMESYLPVLNPPDEYIIPSFSEAVVITRSTQLRAV